jgi:hypothetical protein
MRKEYLDNEYGKIFNGFAHDYFSYKVFSRPAPPNLLKQIDCGCIRWRVAWWVNVNAASADTINTRACGSVVHWHVSQYGPFPAPQRPRTCTASMGACAVS